MGLVATAVCRSWAPAWLCLMQNLCSLAPGDFPCYRGSVCKAFCDGSWRRRQEALPQRPHCLTPWHQVPCPWGLLVGTRMFQFRLTRVSYFFIFCLSFFLGSHLQHTEVPRLGVILSRYTYPPEQCPLFKSSRINTCTQKHTC